MSSPMTPRRRVAAGLRMALSLLAVALLGGCASAPKPLYDWGGYPAALYDYLKGNGNDPGAAIGQLEAQAQRSAASGGRTPPGLHGHLALLYTRMGDDTSALRHLQIERELFPESATYIDFLLKNAARSAAKPS